MNIILRTITARDSQSELSVLKLTDRERLDDMNVPKLIAYAYFINLNKDIFLRPGNKDLIAKTCLEELGNALEEPPDEIEIPAERLEILDE